MTSDGAAWGHGRQSYAFGYGLDGIRGVMENLELFRKTGLKQTALKQEQFDKLFDFADGMSWLQFRTRGCLSVIADDRYVTPDGMTTTPLNGIHITERTSERIG